MHKTATKGRPVLRRPRPVSKGLEHKPGVLHLRPAGSCVLHGAVARPCVPVTRREVSPSGLLGYQTRGTSPTHGFLAGTWRAQGSGPRGHAHRPALQALHQNRPHWGVYLHFSFFFILAHEFYWAPPCDTLSSVPRLVVITTSRYSIPHNGTLQHGQRSGSPRPLGAQPPSSMAENMRSQQWQAGGTSRAVFQDLELSHRRDLRTSTHPAPSRRRQP